MAKVLRYWKKRDFTVSKGSLNRLLQDMHFFQPEITKRDYAENNLPRKADTLLKIAESQHKYHIRDFSKYNYVLDDWPKRSVIDDVFADETSSDDDDNNESNDDDDSSSDDRSPSNNAAEDSSEDDTPTCADYCLDMKRHIAKENAKAKDTSSDIHKMVYFGLENILTCSNSAGNIQKGSYLNYLRAIALFDPHALTDDVVNRIFPKSCKV
jgi:hypothetical protein